MEAVETSPLGGEHGDHPGVDRVESGLVAHPPGDDGLVRRERGDHPGLVEAAQAGGRAGHEPQPGGIAEQVHVLHEHAVAVEHDEVGPPPRAAAAEVRLDLGEPRRGPHVADVLARQVAEHGRSRVDERGDDLAVEVAGTIRRDSPQEIAVPDGEPGVAEGRAAHEGARAPGRGLGRASRGADRPRPPPPRRCLRGGSCDAGGASRARRWPRRRRAGAGSRRRRRRRRTAGGSARRGARRPREGPRRCPARSTRRGSRRAARPGCRPSPRGRPALPASRRAGARLSGRRPPTRRGDAGAAGRPSNGTRALGRPSRTAARRVPRPPHRTTAWRTLIATVRARGRARSRGRCTRPAAARSAR